MEGNKKKYSFMSLVNGIRSDGQPFVSCTVLGRVVNPSEIRQTQTGKQVINFSLPVARKTQYIAKMCGTIPTEDKDETVWLRVSVWDDLATRFANFIQRFPQCEIVAVGNIRVRQNVNPNTGEVTNRAEMSMVDFALTRSFNNANGQASGRQDGYNAPTRGGYNAPTQQGGYNVPAQQGGSYGTPAQNSGYSAPAQQPGRPTTAQQRGYGTPAQQPGYGAPAQQGSYGSPAPQNNAASAQQSGHQQAANAPQFEEIGDDDGELPF